MELFPSQSSDKIAFFLFISGKDRRASACSQDSWSSYGSFDDEDEYNLPPPR